MAVRRVRRVIRKIDPWTVLKVSLIFNAIAGLIFVLGVWVMWSLAIQRGIPEQVSDFFSNFALVFNPEGELYFRVVVLLTVIWVVSFTGLLTLGAVLYNLISDVVGGVEFIVLEETYAVVTTTRQAPLRPAVHMPVTDDVDTVQDETLAEGEDVVEPAAAAEAATADEEMVDEDITVEDDELPVRAASEG
jgi:Transmembrane domain of unknown function (DUF3566)